MKSNFVYLVGNDESPKTNQWMAMTPSKETAEEYMREKGLTTMKAVDTRPKGKRGQRRDKRASL